MRNLHSNIVTNVSDILLDIDGVILDQSFDNLFWQELGPLELSSSKSISIESAKAEIKKTASKIHGTLPWYELEYWENKYDAMPIKRKIVVSTMQQNLSLLFNRSELNAFKDLLFQNTKKVNDNLSVLDIDYTLILN